MIPGRSFSRAANPKPMPSITPGRKLSNTTSALPNSSRSSDIPCCDSRFKVIPRLLVCKYRYMPLLSESSLSPASDLANGPRPRASSSPTGDSTLITSAPKSANILVHSGPATFEERSITRRSDSAVITIPQRP